MLWVQIIKGANWSRILMRSQILSFLPGTIRCFRPWRVVFRHEWSSRRHDVSFSAISRQDFIFLPAYKFRIFRILSTHPKYFAPARISASGTKSNKNIGWKKCIFALANLQTHYPDRSSVFFWRIRPHFSIVQQHLRYHFETCTFDRVAYMVKFGSQSSPKLILF